MLKRLLFVICMATIVILALVTVNPLGIGSMIVEMNSGHVGFLDAVMIYGSIIIVLLLMVYFLLRIIR